MLPGKALEKKLAHWHEQSHNGATLPQNTFLCFAGENFVFC